MTQDERKLIEMALKALEVAKQHIWLGDKAGVEANIKAHQTIIFIKEALAQPETPHEIGQRIAKTGGGISHLWSAVSQDDEIAEAERGFKEALAQPEQDQDEVDIRSRLYQRIHELETQLAQPEQDWIERERAVGYREGHQNALKQMAQPEQEPVALKLGECWPENVMQMWDYYRKEIANGNTGSEPRDWFESLAEMRLVDTAPPQRKPLTSQERDAKRWRFLMENSYDSESVTQFHVWEHSWEPHSQTGEPTEWKQRVRGIALIDFIDRAIEAAHGIKE